MLFNINFVVVVNIFFIYWIIPSFSVIGMVDTIFADVAQPDQARIVALNAHHFLKNSGHVVMSIKVQKFY